MNRESKNEDLDKVRSVIKRSGLTSNESFELDKLSGDGSDRGFCRVILHNNYSFLVVFPSASNSMALAEAISCNLIGQHLFKHNVPVPKVLFFEEDTGVIIYEYLGDLLLHDYVCEVIKKNANISGGQIEDYTDIKKLYCRVLDQLIKLQIDGRNGFAAKKICWDTEKYDTQLILSRETGYFISSFCCDYLGIKEFNDNLENEFVCLAKRVAKEPSDFLLHRDFQSRNVMIHKDQIRIIDFQGARLGPLAYDLASLLNDPYVELPFELRESLLEYYTNKVTNVISFDCDSFKKGYYHLALLRNLQVLGAFAFLTKAKGKNFFQKYLAPAFTDLSHKMSTTLKMNYPILAELVSKIECDHKWKNLIYN